MGPGDDLDDYTLRRQDVARPSRGLEEVLNGIILSVAKERFEGRESTPYRGWLLHEDQKIVEKAKKWAAEVYTPSDAAYEVYQKLIRSEEISAEEQMILKEEEETRRVAMRRAEEVWFQENSAVEDQTAAVDEEPSHDKERRETGHGITLESMDINNNPTIEIISASVENANIISDQESFVQPDQGVSTLTQEDSVLADHLEPAETEFERNLGVAPAMGPIVSADDERSRELLRPTIRSTLSRLDQLLIALHQARQNCVRYSSEIESQTSQDEGVDAISDDVKNDASAPKPASTPHRRRRGRPRKTLDNFELSGPDMAEPSSTKIFEAESSPKKGKQGRPKKVHKQLEGESHQEMLIRIARLQKKSISSILNANAEYRPPVPSEFTEKQPQRQHSMSRNRHRRQSTHLNLRDWSEIIGTASLVGFPPHVVARATQRCANLFGEGMVVNSLALDAELGPDVIGSTRYVPQPIPDLLESLGQVRKRSNDDSETENDDEAMSEAPEEQSDPLIRRRSVSRQRRHRSHSLAPSRRSHSISSITSTDVLLPFETFPCPAPTCPRHAEGFRQRVHVRSHLQHAHKLAGSELESAYASVARGCDSDDEILHDGVHADGFLQLVRGRSGWRGRDLEGRVRRSRNRERSEEGMRGEERGG